MKSSIITHLAAAAIFSLIMALIYATVQQTYRTAANDPQLQLARDIVHDIRYNLPHRYRLDSTIDAQQSLGTFMQLYDINGNLISSGCTINGKAPQIPKGVIDNAKQYVENAVTWQPTADVRLATVAEYTGDNNRAAFVVIARSLLEVENREARLVKMILLSWAIGISIIIIHALIQRRLNKAA